MLSLHLFAADSNNSDTLSKLAHERTWLKLLYYDEAMQQSDVVSDDYFISPRGRIDPLEELKATIEAYNKPFSDNPDEHAICRFPARYYWLSQKFDLKGYQTIHPKCENLYKSINNTPIDSISLMFVSGYLGNPASSFGHSFLKLNNRNGMTNNLFDLSISYGADVPENENIFAYMYKGLFGKYVAAFKDKYFFSQDLVYSSNEFRDIWEYELNLPSEKILFFQLHLWEIIGKKFQYLFLSKNCGYEVSKMLEIPLEHEVVKSANVWFAPIESFHAIADINISEELVKQRIYHPSEQKKVYKRFEELSLVQKEIAVYLIENDMQDTQNRYENLAHTEKNEIIDFAIAYYNYLLVKEKDDNHQYEKLKKKALMARFALPAQRENELKFTGVMAPDYNDKPSVFSMNFNVLKNKTDYASVVFTPYAIKSTGRNNLNGDELVVLETELGFSSKKVFLKKFDFINIKQFNRYDIALNDEIKLSWQLDISVENIDIEKEHYDAFIRGGVGKAYTFTDYVMAYILLNTDVHSYDRQIIIGPEIGVRLDFGATKVVAKVENGFDVRTKDTLNSVRAISSTKVSKDIALFLQYQNRKNEPYRITTGIQYFF